jgi:hypothetical protein
MPCDTRTSSGQTLSERKSQVRTAIIQLDALLKKRLVKPVVGPQGAVAFLGWPDALRGAVSDACAFRIIMATGSAIARAEIARAEQMAGRTVDRKMLTSGVHSHDGGQSWGRD